MERTCLLQLVRSFRVLRNLNNFVIFYDCKSIVITIYLFIFFQEVGRVGVEVLKKFKLWITGKRVGQARDLLA